MIFRELAVWIDPVARSGPEAMAVDEWLFHTALAPVLRIYRWRGNWGSFGYFGNLAAARAALPELSWVRRWTGGGTVDHRFDWTYSVVAPAGTLITTIDRSESYREVHTALAAALGSSGVVVMLESGDAPPGGALCFRNPVRYDLVGENGEKIAGAGQRRSRGGLLHQGSVAVAGSEGLAQEFAERLAARVRRIDLATQDSEILALVSRRYGDRNWTEMR
jgi:lipoate-protein ligase A